MCKLHGAFLKMETRVRERERERGKIPTEKSVCKNLSNSVIMLSI